MIAGCDTLLQFSCTDWNMALCWVWELHAHMMGHMVLLMCRGTYPRRWGLGPMALKKKQLIAEGKLDKHGRPNEQTPVEYLRSLPAVSLLF